MKRAVLLVGAAFACHPNPANTVSTAASAATDTVRGVLVIEGSDPFPIPTLRTAAGRIVIDSAGAGLLKLSQLELWLRGVRADSTHFRVTDYRVRGANGAPAYDGMLRADADGLRVELENGSTRPLRGAPSQLRQLVGSRIWFTENANGTLREYGVF